MGIIVSNENLSKYGVDQDVIRLSPDSMISLVNTFTKHHFLPVVMKPDAHSLFMTAFVKPGNHVNYNELFSTCWMIFNQNEICCTLEVLICLTLLCEADWRLRLGLIFDLIKSPCTSDITKDDITLGVEVTTEALKKLWGVNDSTTLSSIQLAEQREELQSLAESVACSAFIKLGKDLNDGLSKEEFLNWGMERFKSSKSIASIDSLKQLF